MNKQKWFIIMTVFLVVLGSGCFSPTIVDEEIDDNFTKIKRCMVWDGVMVSKTYNCNNTICLLDLNETENATLTRAYINWVDMNKDSITELIERESTDYSSASLNPYLREYSFEMIDYDMQIYLYNGSFFGDVMKYHNCFESIECIEYIEVFQKEHPDL